MAAPQLNYVSMRSVSDGIFGPLFWQLDLAVVVVGRPLPPHLRSSRVPHVVRQVRLRIQHEGEAFDRNVDMI